MRVPIGVGKHFEVVLLENNGVALIVSGPQMLLFQFRRYAEVVRAPKSCSK